MKFIRWKHHRVKVSIEINGERLEDVWKIIADADDLVKLHPDVEIEMEFKNTL